MHTFNKEKRQRKLGTDAPKGVILLLVPQIQAENTNPHGILVIINFRLCSFILSIKTCNLFDLFRCYYAGYLSYIRISFVQMSLSLALSFWTKILQQHHKHFILQTFCHSGVRVCYGYKAISFIFYVNCICFWGCFVN